MKKLIRKIREFDLDRWLDDTAADAGIEGGQGRAGGAVLFSALMMTGGTLTIVFIAAVIVAGRACGLLQ